MSLRAHCFVVALVCALIACPVLAADHPSPVRGVGLVLGGGGARGLAHMGVIEELERLRIPISCIAGTSAGALVGGVYASGMPIKTLIKAVETADWNRMMTGAPRRADLPYERKKDDFKNLMDATLGVGPEGVRVPRAALSTQDIDIFLRQLTRDIVLDDFDSLPIPFQAIATDLVSGKPVEFAGGDLAVALRSSMAVPGVFDLVEQDGRLLVDGMLIRNVPVQNVKGRCADDVIVVDVGTPLLKKEEIRSFVDVADQQSNIYVRLNVRHQLALMGSDDVLIQPMLNGVSSANFGEGKAIIERGREAVAPVAARLARYQVSEAEYAEWKASVQARLPEELKLYSEVRIASKGFVPESRVGRFFNDGEHSIATQSDLVSRIESLYATGDFDRIAYSLRDQDGKRVADVTPIERTVGPNYLRLGLDFKLDSYGNSDVAFLGNLQMTWLNAWGGQWRNDVRVGSGSYLQTEFFQPLAHSRWFTSASANFARDKYSIWGEGRKQTAEVEVFTREAELGFGYSMGALGEARVSSFSRYLDGNVRIGPSDLIPGGERSHGLRAYAVIDQLDNPRFPRSGYLGKLDYHYQRNESDGVQHTLNVTADAAHSVGKFTGRATMRLAGNLDPGASLSQIHTLGGFLNLSGLNTAELIGERTAFFRLMGYRRIVSILPNLGSGMYIGASGEMGRVWRQVAVDGDTPWLMGGSVFVGVDTLLGPLFAAYGQTEGGRRAGYLYLGVSY